MPTAEFVSVTIDCPDPKELSDFYAKLTDWNVIYSDENAAYLAGDGPVRIGFQRVADYRKPSWPTQDAGQQLHLDFQVADLDSATDAATALGAKVADQQSGGDRWRVLVDPAGHPFCLTLVS